ncbi:class II fructose-bisphosphate aldolase [Pseudonocardia sp. CA-107938]|uniref:class II fructose-bisphosphate aldolase n=1 Tax=Pseudonocardia sp. CA-107938 TaxID=3240021 RepID=UPI003D9248ED
MPYAPTAEIVADAVAAGRGVAAFNVIGLEHAEAVVGGAERAERPVLLQVSQNAVAFRGRRLRPLAAACRELAAAAKVQVGLHLDHVEDEELARQAADAGFGSLMVDASRAPYAENVARTRALADWAHEQGLWVEAELGEVGGKGGAAPLDAHAPGARTDPAEAAGFVAATGVDGLAVAVGSVHAMTERTARLDIDLVAALHAAVPVPLVLHGSSGVADDELRRALGAGIVKVNVGTALNVAYTAAVRDRLLDACVVDPRRYLAPAIVDMAAEVQRYLAVLG